MATIIIAKNNTSSYIDLDDLGLTLNPNETINLTEIFTKNDIIVSEDLKTRVQSGDITINDGTQDLSSTDGLMHIRVETEYEDLEDMPVAEGELPATTITRSTNFPISTTPTVVTFDQQIIQNASIVLEWDSAEPTKIQLKQSGIYLAVVKIEKDITVDVNITYEIRLNGDVVDQSQFTTKNNHQYEDIDNITTILQTNQPSYVELYIYGNQNNGNITKVVFGVIKLQGSKGDPGDPGTGSTVNVMDGINTWTNINTLNFINFVVSETTAGRADIVVDPAAMFNEAAICQIRNLSNVSLATTFTDIKFDTTDIQNATDVLVHSSSFKDRINIKKDGLYMMAFSATFDGTSSLNTNVYCRVRVNDNIVIPGSEYHGRFYRNEIQTLSFSCFHNLKKDDYISFQCYADDDMTMLENYTFACIKCDAIKGEKGDPGISGGDDLAALQIRRTNLIKPTSSSNWRDVDFEVKDVETFPAYLEYDPNNADRILIQTAGTYQFNYSGNVREDDVEIRLRVNDSIVINGSYQEFRPDGNDIEAASASCIFVFNTTGFVTLQIKGDTHGELHDLVLNVVKLEGAKGEPGDPGGSDVDIQLNDQLISENVSVINFEGAVGVTNVPGKTTVTIQSNQFIPQIFQGYDANGGVDLNTTSPVAIPITGEVIKDSYYSHDINSLTNSRITILHSGWYRISYNISSNNQTNGRKTILCYARKNGNSNILNSESYSYTRNRYDRRTTNCAAFFTYLNQNDYIQILGRRDGSSGACDTIAGQSWICLEFIKE